MARQIVKFVSSLFGSSPDDDPITCNLQRSRELLFETYEIYHKITKPIEAVFDSQQTIYSRIHEIIAETQEIIRNTNDLKLKEVDRRTEIDKIVDETRQILATTSEISKILEQEASHKTDDNNLELDEPPHYQTSPDDERKDQEKISKQRSEEKPEVAVSCLIDDHNIGKPNCNQTNTSLDNTFDEGSKSPDDSPEQKRVIKEVKKQSKITKITVGNLKDIEHKLSFNDHRKPNHSSEQNQAGDKKIEDQVNGKTFNQREEKKQIDSDMEDKEDNIPRELSQNDAQSFMKILEKVDFDKYFPQKLSLSEALSICKVHANETITEPGVLMKLMLQKIMMSNYTSRKLVLRNEVTINEDDDSDDDDHDHDDIMINPMDAVIAILLCADDFLRQDIYAKLTCSQLAVPLLLPNPIDNTIIFPLWAMRSIVKNWKCQKGKSDFEYNGCLIEHDSPLISFVRFSQPRTQSKSKLLNNIISTQKHSIFFDCDCIGSQAKRIVNGVVEVCWYLPSGEKSDCFNSLITFANLRGNSKNYEQQFHFLLAHSDMVFVLLQEDDVTANELYFRKLSSANQMSQIVFLADKWSADKKNILKNIVKNSTYISLERSGLAAIVAKIQNKITKRINENCPLIFHKLSQVNDLKIHTDENKEVCKHSMVLATDIISDIKEVPISEAKETMVPLQGPNLWHKWASLNKKVVRMKYEETEAQGIETYHQKKSSKKDIIRMKQIEKAKFLPTVMQKFMRSLSESDFKERQYFLQWLRFHMDAHSRDVLPELQKGCQAIRSKLRNKSITDQSELESLKIDYHAKSQQLIYASFGVEHFFRELGQIYEAAKHLKQSTIPFDVAKFPILAANLLISGHPLELVDGDAAHIPIVWVTAVLKELSKLIGNSNMLVLSVLGIQSTGKSTLMNTTFGVQFAVSAGRCTRGAYFQLLRLDPEFTKEACCEYLLIIDTEGLRAPELSAQDTQQHDNELATLVIGLANVTIINILGEVPADIDDILQTSVHAFLRMKEVSLKPSCIFVRQNVTNVAANKMVEGRQKFFERLDSTTAKAAKAEHCEDKYKYFSDVIAFNESDVLDFPNLWEGNPPMAPVNPAYCDACLKLKSKISQLCVSKQFICTLDDFTNRIEQLWEAVLKENFIFSFKNTLEVEAYSILDTEYSKWSWKLKDVFLKWQNETQNLIISHQIIDLDRIKADQIKKVEHNLDLMHEEIMKEVTKFFEEPNSSLTSIIIQWHARCETRLLNLRNDYKDKAKMFCNERTRSRYAKIKMDEKKNTLRNHFTTHLKKFVSERNIENEHFSDTQLEQMFHDQWNKQMEDIAAVPPPSKEDIDLNICNALRRLMTQHDKLIISKLKKIPLNERGNPLKVVIDVENHLNIRNYEKIKNLFGYGQECEQMAQEFTDRILSSVVSYLSKPSVITYEDSHFDSVFITLTSEIGNFEKKNKGSFTFTAEYRTDLFLEVAGFALSVFNKKQNEEYNNHPAIYMETLKPYYKQIFEADCKKISYERSAASCLTKIVLKKLDSSLKDQLALALVDDLKKNVIFFSKTTLKGNILLRLLEKDDFMLFIQYLTNVSRCYLYWINQLMMEHCDQFKKGKKLIVALANDVLESLLKQIIDAAEDSTSTGVREWFDCFHSKLSKHIPLNHEELYDLVQMKHITDLKFFVQEFLKEIKRCKESYLDDHPNVLNIHEWCDNDPSIIIRDDIAGCCEQCPFCKEQCEANFNHDDDCEHACKLHRPKCLGGYCRVADKTMVLDICTDSVGSDRYFRNPKTKDDFVPYRDYKKIHPDWNIPNEKCQIAPYWKWFVVKYEKRIVEYFEFSTTPIPADWKNVTADGARKDVIDRYRLEKK